MDQASTRQVLCRPPCGRLGISERLCDVPDGGRRSSEGQQKGKDVSPHIHPEAKTESEHEGRIGLYDQLSTPVFSTGRRTVKTMSAMDAPPSSIARLRVHKQSILSYQIKNRLRVRTREVLNSLDTQEPCAQNAPLS